MVAVGLLPDGAVGAVRRLRIWPRRPWRATCISAATAACREAAATGVTRGFTRSMQSFHRLFFFLPRPIRLLLLKDLRTFCRDPAQWSQFLIFFGLLAFYFLNIPRLGYGVQSPSWRNLVSFLNLSVTALILSTFTSRFIFPLLSLEGRNFWVLGLLPVRARADPLGQVCLLGGDLAAGDRGARVPLRPDAGDGPGDDRAPSRRWWRCSVLGLSGISVGLGARLPNLRETDPSKIAVGFGGTLNLLVSLVFIFAIVTAMAIPCHLYFLGQRESRTPRTWHSRIGGIRFWLSVAIVVSLIDRRSSGRSFPCGSASRRSSAWNSRQPTGSGGLPRRHPPLQD